MAKSEIEQLKTNSKQKIPLPKFEPTSKSGEAYTLQEKQLTAGKSIRSDPLE